MKKLGGGVISGTTAQLKAIDSKGPFVFWDTSKWFEGIRIPAVNNRGFVELYVHWNDTNVLSRSCIDNNYFGDWS